MCIRDSRKHEDVVGIYYRSIIYVDSFEDLDIESNKISMYFPDWDSKKPVSYTHLPAWPQRRPP